MFRSIERTEGIAQDRRDVARGRGTRLALHFGRNRPVQPIPNAADVFREGMEPSVDLGNLLIDGARRFGDAGLPVVDLLAGLATLRP